MGDGRDRSAVARPSINIPPVPPLRRQSADVRLGLVVAEAAVVADDLAEGAVDVGGHALGVAADVDVGARFEPAVELAAVLADAVLDVDLPALVAAEGRVEAGQE